MKLAAPMAAQLILVLGANGDALGPAGTAEPDMARAWVELKCKSGVASLMTFAGPHLGI